MFKLFKIHVLTKVMIHEAMYLIQYNMIIELKFEPTQSLITNDRDETAA